MELFEADVAGDPLQRLHALHNASLSFTSLLQVLEASRVIDDRAKKFFEVLEAIKRKGQQPRGNGECAWIY